MGCATRYHAMQQHPSQEHLSKPSCLYLRVATSTWHAPNECRSLQTSQRNENIIRSHYTMQTAAALSFPTLVQIHSTCLMWSIASLNPLVFYACHLKKKKKKTSTPLLQWEWELPPQRLQADGWCVHVHHSAAIISFVRARALSFSSGPSRSPMLSWCSCIPQ